jgi:hypothetical protein
MLQAMIFREVPLAAIDFEDETFRISEDLELAEMSSSLHAVGLINPVVLLEGMIPSRFKIVCGFRRLHGLRNLGVAAAAAKILPSTEFTPVGLFLMAVWDNLSHRRFSPLEAARVLSTFKHTCGIENTALVEFYLPLLGLSPHKNVLQSFLHLHRLHPELRRLLNAGQLTPASAERLAQTAPEIQAGAAPLLGRIRLSASLQREVLDLAEDLAAIIRTTLAAVLSQPEISAIADDAVLSPFQKGERIYSFLYCRRNPRISHAREKFNAEKAALDLPGTVRLSADPFFESPRLRVEFDVSSAQAFRETVEALERSGRKASLDRLFEVS